MSADAKTDAQDAESAYGKAAKAEHSRDYDLAYRLYVKSAELYLHLVRSCQNPDSDAASLRAKAEKAIQRAEKLKAFVESSVSKSVRSTRLGQSSTAKNITPVPINHFSIQEQSYVLWKGGFVNGHVFPPWDEPVQTESAQSIYTDPDGQPVLSPEQAKVSPCWRRPSHRSSLTSEGILPQEILQLVISDCSVCASISVCLEHSRRFGSKLAEEAVHTVLLGSRIESESGMSGRYDIKVFFNGTWRRIGDKLSAHPVGLVRLMEFYLVVDDTLPYDPGNDTWMCLSVRAPRNDAPPIWPSILEKSYMKLMGGYDFLGSNSCIDLHTLTGWIPEHLETKESNFERERVWQRIFDGFRDGHCILTLGTGATTRGYWEGSTLLPSHSYAVIDVKEEEDVRILTFLDTWAGAPDEEYLTGGNTTSHPIPWLDALNVFDGIYISWDPSRWSTTLVHQGRWQGSATREQTSTRQMYLQFENSTAGSEQELWVLLTRHVTDRNRQADFIALKVDLDDDPNEIQSTLDLTTLAAKGSYTNSTHILARTKIPVSQSSGVLSIFTSYDGNSPEVGFTLTVYAGADVAITWNERFRTLPYKKQADSFLNSRNAGGNSTYPTFMLNPQYRLQFHQGRSAQTQLTLTMQTRRDIPVNILLGCSQGERIFHLPAKDVIATSGAYTYGLARLSLSRPLPARDYTVILSTFEPQQLGEFSFSVESSESFDMKAIPQEGAGMYTKVIRGSWTSRTAAGGPTFMRYSENPIFEIDVPLFAQIKVRLQLCYPSPATSVNLTIFPATADGSLRHYSTTSGAYNDAICGVVTPQVALTPGKYWAIPSSYNPGVETGFQLYLYTNIQNVKIMERERG